MERVKKNKANIIICEFGKYTKQYINDLITQDGYRALSVSPVFDHYKKAGPFTVKNKRKVLDILKKDAAIGKRPDSYLLEQLEVLDTRSYLGRRPLALSTLQKKKLSLFLDTFNGCKRILLHDTEGSPLNYLDMVKFLAQSKEFEGGSVVLFTEAKLSDLLMALGTELSAYKIYNLLYQDLNELDCDGYKALVSLRSINAIDEKHQVEVYATLLFGEVCGGDILRNIYGGPELQLIGDPECVNSRFEQERVSSFSKKDDHFYFYLDLNHYVDVNPPKLLIKK